MRLVEEKKYMKLQFISLFVVFVSTILIQIADSKIDEYNSLVIEKILEASNKLQIEIGYKIQTEFSTLKQLIPWKEFKNKDQLLNDLISSSKDRLYPDPNVTKLRSKLEKGEISINEYYAELVIINGRKASKKNNEYNALIIEINNALKTPTHWKFWKNFVFIPLQILFLLFLALGYYTLLRDISKRTPIKSKKI